MSNEKNDKPKQNSEDLGKLLDHDYDGIRELDNPLPGWWLATFYGAIVFAFFYFAYYQLGGGATLDQELQADLAGIQKKFQAHIETQGPSHFEELLKNPASLASGKAVFDGKCAVCHGPKGEGIIGPNLTDNYWISGDGSAQAIHKVVQKGVLEKGMPAWEAQLKPAEVELVATYVFSLAGSNPPNPKAPQGEKY